MYETNSLGESKFHLKNGNNILMNTRMIIDENKSNKKGQRICLLERNCYNESQHKSTEFNFVQKSKRVR